MGLDIGVYGVLAGVVGLTLYSLVVTLQQSNDKYGGCTPEQARKREEVLNSPKTGDLLQSGAVYGPVTEQWTYPKPVKEKASARVGRDEAGGAAGNRYDRRMQKKRKQNQQ